MNAHSESWEDVENVEAWAEVIKDLLYLVPCDRSATVLALATKNDKIKEADWKPMSFSDDWINEPGQRHWHAIMRLKSLVIQVFARDINNNHSPEEATRILFAEHPHGYGSGLLEDYIHLRTSKRDSA
jgi:hypothetical protein